MDLFILTQGLRFEAVNILSVRKSVEIAPIFYFPRLLDSLVQGRHSIPFCYCLILLT